MVGIHRLESQVSGNSSECWIDNVTILALVSLLTKEFPGKKVWQYPFSPSTIDNSDRIELTLFFEKLIPLVLDFLFL